MVHVNAIRAGGRPRGFFSVKSNAGRHIAAESLDLKKRAVYSRRVISMIIATK
jgi:hypothetical protein